MRPFDSMPAMDPLRSEKMGRVQLIIPVECTYLGDLGLLQFKDVKRCGEMFRKLKFLRDQVSKAELLSSIRPSLQPNLDMEELEVCLSDHEHEFLEMNSNTEKLRQTYTELLEFKFVLLKAGNFLVSDHSDGNSQEREVEENVLSRAEDYGEGTSLLEQVVSRLSDLEAALDAGLRHRNDALGSIGSHLQQWTMSEKRRLYMIL